MAKTQIKNTTKELLHIERSMHGMEHQFQTLLSSTSAIHKKGALNLLQYLWLRQLDITQLQVSLHALGLSSISSSESHIQRQIQEVLCRLGVKIKPADFSACDALYGQQQTKKKATKLFGKNDDTKHISLMITLDSTVATDVEYLAKLLLGGMRIARINCAHDDEKTWSNMAQALKKAQAQTGLPCKIYMDLAGPKFRVQLPGKGKSTGKMEIALHDLIPLYEPDAPCLENERVIACHQAGVVEKLVPGAIILIDDGMIEATVRTSIDHKAIVQITRISGKPFIKAGKGMNFPHTYIEANPLTKDDIFSLNAVLKYAHMVGYSFVRTPADIAFLRSQINHLKGTKKEPHLIIKIETPESVSNLPNLLFEAMKDGIFGVMIARGDLAVEIGFERLSEIQEEILWLCEASHTPVIWATQVLEQLNKTGVASRSEITDAYKAAQSECIMVNKGTHVLEVLSTLQNVAKRSRRHHLKKRYALPPLQIAADFFKKHK